VFLSKVIKLFAAGANILASNGRLPCKKRRASTDVISHSDPWRKGVETSRQAHMTCQSGAVWSSQINSQRGFGWF